MSRRPGYREIGRQTDRQTCRQTVSRCWERVASRNPIPQDPDMTTSSVTHTRADLNNINTEPDRTPESVSGYIYFIVD